MQTKNNKKTRVIAVTGGKGGVGKSNMSLNLAISFAKRKQKVILLDADLGLANLDILLGIRAEKNLSHVLRSECDLRDTFIHGPHGITIVPGASGLYEMTNLSDAVHTGIIHAFEEVADEIDCLIVDTAAGIAGSVLTFASAAHDILVVVNNEPTSISDAYALLKALANKHDVRQAYVIANRVNDTHEGFLLFNKLASAVNRFLEMKIDYLGLVPDDILLSKAVKQHRAFVDIYPRAKGATAIQDIAEKIMQLPMPAHENGKIQFFVQQLIRSQAQ